MKIYKSPGFNAIVKPLFSPIDERGMQQCIIIKTITQRSEYVTLPVGTICCLTIGGCDDIMEPIEILKELCTII